MSWLRVTVWFGLPISLPTRAFPCRCLPLAVHELAVIPWIYPVALRLHLSLRWIGIHMAYQMGIAVGFCPSGCHFPVLEPLLLRVFFKFMTVEGWSVIWFDLFWHPYVSNTLLNIGIVVFSLMDPTNSTTGYLAMGGRYHQKYKNCNRFKQNRIGSLIVNFSQLEMCVVCERISVVVRLIPVMWAST